jgi:hypothetical protein
MVLTREGNIPWKSINTELAKIKREYIKLQTNEDCDNISYDVYLSIGHSLQPNESLQSDELLQSDESLQSDDDTKEIVAELEKVKKLLSNNNDKMSIQLKIINQLKKLYK